MHCINYQYVNFNRATAIENRGTDIVLKLTQHGNFKNKFTFDMMGRSFTVINTQNLEPLQTFLKRKYTFKIVKIHIVCIDSFHFISFHFISFHFISFHFIPFRSIPFRSIPFHTTLSGLYSVCQVSNFVLITLLSLMHHMRRRTYVDKPLSQVMIMSSISKHKIMFSLV